MIVAALVALQNLADSQKARSLCSGMSLTFPQDAYQVISVKAEVPTDAEAEKDPLAITSTEIKAESVVSCVSVSMLGQFR
jgi:hypothetical protein